MMDSGKVVKDSYWFFAPNKGAPVFFAVAFGISTAWHLWQCMRLKAWRITALQPLVGALLTAGFVLREIGAFNYTLPKIYVASVALVYFSPPILELANYHAFGRNLYYIPYYSPIHPGRTLTTFGMISAVIEVLNALGVTWTANKDAPDKIMKLGDTLLKASLLIQMAVILIFCTLVATFHYRVARGGVLTRATNGPCTTMYISSFLILIRCVYRTIQHFATVPLGAPGAPTTIEGLNKMNPILRYEWYFYVFEAVPLLINSFLWNFRHPRHYLPADYHVYLAQDGVTEIVGPGWKDDRGFIASLCDPFGCMDSGSKQRPFWETNGFHRGGSPDLHAQKYHSHKRHGKHSRSGRSRRSGRSGRR